MAFDPKRHMMRVQGGKEYLPVSARLIWFREEHPDWGIMTESVEINLEKQYAIFKAVIMDENGKTMATATKMENVRGFADYLEKAETGSVGRALAYCGYGTQFAPELEEGERIADTPRTAREHTRPAPPAEPEPVEEDSEPEPEPVEDPEQRKRLQDNFVKAYRSAGKKIETKDDLFAAYLKYARITGEARRNPPTVEGWKVATRNLLSEIRGAQAT